MSRIPFDLTAGVFRTLAENSVDAIAISDLEGKLIYGNRACYHLFGFDYEKKELLGLPFASLSPEEDVLILTEEVLPQAMDGGWRGEMRRKRKDGSLFDAYLSVFALTDEGGNPIGVAAIIRDITEQKRAEEALRESERKYRSLIAHIPDVTWTASYEGGTSFISANVEEVYGFTPEEILQAKGGLWLGRIHPEDVEHVQEAYKLLFTENTKFDVEYRIQRKDGRWIWLHERATSIYEKDGALYADGIFSDITERKRLEEDRERLQHKIIEAQRRALQELSTPIVPVIEGVLVLPLVGSIDTWRAQQVMETLLEAISQYQAKVVIVDITGVMVVDTGVANHLMQVVRAAGLLGSECVLVGISPEVAQTIVSLGVDLSSISTQANLQSGIEYALRKTGRRIVARHSLQKAPHR